MLDLFCELPRCSTVRCVWLVLYQCYDDEELSISIAYLADLAGCSPPSAKRAVSVLEAKGILTVRRCRGRGKTNVYRLTRG